MCPVAWADRHDGPGLLDEVVPGIERVVKDVVVGGEDTVGEPIVADELPDVFDRVEFGRFRRQRHQGDVGGNDSLSERCHPAWSSSSTAWAPGVTVWEISARCSAIAAVLQRGRMRPAPVPRAGQMAPKM